MVESRDIIKFLNGRRYRPMNAKELAEHFVIPKEGQETFLRLLRSLELQGDIVQIKQRQYAIPSKVNLMVGTLKCSPRGYGFVVPLKDGGHDIYVGEEEMGEAMHGDTVVVRLPKATATRSLGRGRGRRWGRGRRRFASGQIVNVIEHVNETIIGTLEKTRRLGYVVPDNPSLFRDIYVADDDTAGAQVGQKVIVKVTQWPSRHLAPEGMVVEVLGQDGDPVVDVLSVVYQFQLPLKFKPETEDEANRLSQTVPKEEYKNRLDLRKDTTMTIDPEDAKDFDDAISIRKDQRGNWHLYVHVADVSYYVQPDSALDEEARKRGTSVYFPGQVVPMLPAPLSEGVCSLREKEDRFTKSVLLEYSPAGKLVSSQIIHSAINVNKRLTYKEASLILAGDEAPSTGISHELKEMIFLMAELAEILLARRMERGALELDLPEVSLRLDDEGRVASVDKVERDLAHEIIEEFMLAANEAVARFMHEKKLPYFSRVHP
ncbi:MAG: ribonuclease R family protein, partial [Candidatus Brocadiales bacterium]